MHCLLFLLLLLLFLSFCLFFDLSLLPRSTARLDSIGICFLVIDFPSRSVRHLASLIYAQPCRPSYVFILRNMSFMSNMS